MYWVLVFDEGKGVHKAREDVEGGHQDYDDC
jgi:hypothetical protein